jgi:restriction system protein
MRRRDREQLIDQLINGVFGLAVVAGVLAWLSSKNLLVGLVVLVLGVLVLVVALRFFERWRQRRFRSAGLDEIDAMTGEEFEEFLRSHFAGRGRSVRLTPNGADYGADLILKDSDGTTVVQAKRWTHPVGVGAIQEVVAAKAYYGAQKALVVTTSDFTTAAFNLARSNGVEIWDRDKLTRELQVQRPQGAPQ